MRWRKKALAEMEQRIVQLGLQSCKVCDSGSMKIWRMPTMESIGDVYRDQEDPRRDPDSNVLFLVHIECDICGHVMLFNSERLHKSGEKALVVGLTDEEEDALEAAGE